MPFSIKTSMVAKAMYQSSQIQSSKIYQRKHLALVQITNEKLDSNLSIHLQSIHGTHTLIKIRLLTMLSSLCLSVTQD